MLRVLLVALVLSAGGAHVHVDRLTGVDLVVYVDGPTLKRAHVVELLRAHGFHRHTARAWYALVSPAGLSP